MVTVMYILFVGAIVLSETHRHLAVQIEDFEQAGLEMITVYL
jgi:hypothetical protein